MMGPPKIRMPNGKWYTPEILKGQGGFCHQCGGLLVDHENDGYEAVLMPRPGDGMIESERDRWDFSRSRSRRISMSLTTYRIKPVSRKLPDGVFMCLGCGVKMMLKEIEKPVLIATAVDGP